MVRAHLHRLDRIAKQFEAMQADETLQDVEVPDFKSQDDFLDFLAEHLPDYLEEHITGDAEFARTLEGFDGRLSKSPGFKEAFGRSWRNQYQRFGKGGTMYLFPPLDPNTEYEQVRRQVVQMIREQLQKSPDDNVDILIEEVLADDAMLCELNRRHDSVRLARRHQ
jgi:hypothetical protein